MAFVMVWAIFFMGCLLAIPDASSYETWLQRAFRAAGYSFVMCVVAIILGKVFGLSGGDLDFEYRR